MGHCLSKISGRVSSVNSLAFVCSFVMRQFRAKKLSSNSLGRGRALQICRQNLSCRSSPAVDRFLIFITFKIGNNDVVL